MIVYNEDAIVFNDRHYVCIFVYNKYLISNDSIAIIQMEFI